MSGIIFEVDKFTEASVLKLHELKNRGTGNLACALFRYHRYSQSPWLDSKVGVWPYERTNFRVNPKTIGDVMLTHHMHLLDCEQTLIKSGATPLPVGDYGVWSNMRLEFNNGGSLAEASIGNWLLERFSSLREFKELDPINGLKEELEARFQISINA